MPQLLRCTHQQSIDLVSIFLELQKPFLQPVDLVDLLNLLKLRRRQAEIEFLPRKLGLRLTPIAAVQVTGAVWHPPLLPPLRGASLAEADLRPHI